MFGARDGGTARLEAGVTAYRAALEERTRDRVPLDWAIVQNNLGHALERLGIRETGTARLEEAAKTYRAALEVLTPENAAHDHQRASVNLARTLAEIAGRQMTASPSSAT